jgi:hypothetical protein
MSIQSMSQSPDKGQRSGWVKASAIAGAILVLGSATAAIVIWGLIPLMFPPQIGPPLSFDRAVWLDEQSTKMQIRSRMADGLIESRILRGQTREEMVAMLGTPIPQEYTRDLWVNPPDMAYLLGAARDLFNVADCEYLALRFGPDARVADAYILSD